MADTYIRLIQRRDTAANWQTENPVLESGEFGYETDTKKLKIGDGATAWNALPYFTSGGGAVVNDGILSITIDGVTHKFTANQAEDTDIEFTTGGGGSNLHIYNIDNEDESSRLIKVKDLFDDYASGKIPQININNYPYHGYTNIFRLLYWYVDVSDENTSRIKFFSNDSTTFKYITIDAKASETEYWNINVDEERFQAFQNRSMDEWFGDSTSKDTIFYNAAEIFDWMQSWNSEQKQYRISHYVGDKEMRSLCIMNVNRSMEWSYPWDAQDGEEGTWTIWLKSISAEGRELLYKVTTTYIKDEERFDNHYTITDANTGNVIEEM